MNPDFAEILSELTAAGAEFIVVGAFAVAAQSVCTRLWALGVEGAAGEVATASVR